MKQLILIVPALILQNVLNFAQEPLFGSEMRLKVINASPSAADHTFNLIKLSKTYCYELESSSISDCDECPNPNCFSCNGGSYLVTIDESGKYPPNGNPSNEGGAFCKQEGAYLDAVYGYGVYKYIDETTGDYVFIDFRDARYTRESIDPPYEGYHDDFFLRYDGNGYFQLDGEDSGGEGDYEITVPVGGLIQIWKGTWRIQTQNGYEYKSFTLPDVNPFPSGGEDDFWQNCLVIGTHIYQPLQIVWGPNPNQLNISKYYLYRKIDNQSFIKIGEFNNQTFDYKDKSILFTEDGSSTVSYKVTSFNGIESTPTNIASQEYDFEFDWSNGLILTKNGNHPKLVWVPNNTIQNLTGYKIYRKVEDEAFYYMGMVGTNTFTYTDGEVNLNVKESAIQYYVAATNGAQEDPTNTVTAIEDYNPHKENQQGEELSELKYFLSDNYPNPFNPSTSISYSIPENAFVTLKIYDVLGNEVVELINEQKESGNYQIDFNASELSSGIYYYTLTAGNFTSTK